jgi:hypothetical protein
MSTMVAGVLLVCSGADDTIRPASGPAGTRWHAPLGGPADLTKNRRRVRPGSPPMAGAGR